MKKPYSRLAKVEEQRQVRTALKFIFLTIVLLAFLIALGVPLVARLTGFATSFEDNSNIIDNLDKTPPAPPRISNLPQWTNQESLRIEGNTEAGAAVIVFTNNKLKETVADALGNFSVKTELTVGENIIYATSTDNNNNESQQSSRLTVNYDKEPPKVEITKPTDGQTFSGTSQKQINIEGITEAESQVTINGRRVILSSEGKFVFPTSLDDGENSFNIKSTDRASNLSEITIVVQYLP